MEQPLFDDVLRELHAASHLRFPLISKEDLDETMIPLYWSFGFLDGVRFAYEYGLTAATLDRRLFSPGDDRTTHRAVDHLGVTLGELLSTGWHLKTGQEWQDWLTKQAIYATVDPIMTVPVWPQFSEDGDLEWTAIGPQMWNIWEMEQRGGD